MSQIPTINPFLFWQKFWENASPQVKAVMPPMTAAEIDKKITELQNIEVWLNFNLQAVRSQIAVLEQQKSFLDSMEELGNRMSGSYETMLKAASGGAGAAFPARPQQPPRNDGGEKEAGQS